MKSFILNQTKLNAVLDLAKQPYSPVNEAEVNIIVDKIQEVHESMSDIIAEHTTEKLDFEGMGNMISSLFNRDACRHAGEDNVWVARRAKAMGLTAVELVVASNADIQEEYKNEVIVKNGVKRVDGKLKYFSYDWHRNFFMCHGQYVSDMEEYVETDDMPRGLSRESDQLGKATVTDSTNGVKLKLSSLTKSINRQVASVGYVVPDYGEKNLFNWLISSSSYKEQKATTRSKVKLADKYRMIAKGLTKFYDEDVIYMTYGRQSSGRFQSGFGLQDVGLHTGGKYFWRFKYNRVVQWEDRVIAKFIVTQMWSKKVRKRPLSFKQAIRMYKRNQDVIIDWTREHEQDFIKKTYWNEVCDDILLAPKTGKTNLVLRLDITASGPLHMALSFHGEKLGAAVNVNGNKIARDFHGEMMDRSPLEDRDLVKQMIQNPWTHGSGFGTPARNMGVEKIEFIDMLRSAYGEEALYPERIGSWSKLLISGTDQTIFFKRPDNYMAFCKTYYQGAVREVKYLSCLEDKVKSVKIFGDEPLQFGNKSGQVVNVTKTEDSNGKKISKAASGAKLRPLSAVVTHALENVGTTWIYKRVTQPLNSVHDDYGSTGKGLFQVLKHMKSFHLWVYDTKPIQFMLKDAFKRKGIEIDIDKELPLGTLKRSKVANSMAFLQP